MTAATACATALHLLHYMEDCQDYPDAFRRSLQVLASDVGRSHCGLGSIFRDAPLFFYSGLYASKPEGLTARLRL